MGMLCKTDLSLLLPIDEKMKEREIDISEDVRMRKIIWRKVPLFITMQWGILTNRFL
jgi:hypothetical protein